MYRCLVLRSCNASQRNAGASATDRAGGAHSKRAGGGGPAGALSPQGYRVYRPHRPRYRQYRHVAPRAHHRYSSAHVQWCYGRYRSYRASDNTFQPYNGPRRQCRSPYR
ncbi:MAG: BA14K family protein [Aliihoeflea sp.]